MILTDTQLPKLTIVVAVRNNVNTIARALDSVVAQHYPNIELMVMDGLSTDGTLDVIKRYASIISVLRSEQDDGAQDACNKAIGMATGDYIGLLNADDEYEPGVLWAVADNILKNPDAETVTFGMLYKMERSKGQPIVTGYYADEAQLSITLDYALSENQTFVASRFVKRSLYDEVGLFCCDRNLWHRTNDREWLTRLALRGCKNIVIPKALYSFALHENSISNNPENYGLGVIEHLRIAAHLLERKDLNASQRMVIENWRKRQLVYGFWLGLLGGRFQEARSFMQKGLALDSWRFTILSVYLLIIKVLKRIGLRLSNGIDRGTILKGGSQ